VPACDWVLKRQLTLRAALMQAGKIDHDYLFFKASGAPLRNLQYTPPALAADPLPPAQDSIPEAIHGAAHVGELDLMTGRSALWVARQHGHSIATMLRLPSHAAGFGWEAVRDGISAR
jgi:hypothetical protein